jgi:hypothetical protein
MDSIDTPIGTMVTAHCAKLLLSALAALHRLLTRGCIGLTVHHSLTPSGPRRELRAHPAREEKKRKLEQDLQPYEIIDRARARAWTLYPELAVHFHVKDTSPRLSLPGESLTISHTAPGAS